MSDVPQVDDDSVFVYPEDHNDRGADLAPAPLRSRLNVFRSVGRHRGIAIVTAVVVSLASGPVVYLRSIRPVYAAEALLNVSPMIPKNLIEDREFQVPRYDEFVNQQLAMVAREEVTLDALTRLKGRVTLWKRPSEGLRESAVRLGSSLSVKRVSNSTYIAIGLEAAQPDGLAEVVNAVAESYLARVKNQLFYGHETRLEVLSKHKVELNEEIRSKTELLSRWAKELGVTGLDSRPSEAMTAVAEKSLGEARTRRIESEVRRASLKDRQDHLRQMDLRSEARAQLASDASFNGIRNALLVRKSELKAKMIGLTAEHEGRKALERSIAAIDADIAATEEEAMKRILVTFEQRRESRLAEELQGAESDLAQAKRVEEMLAAEAASQAIKASRFNSLYYDIQSVKQDVDRLSRQLAAVQDRIDFTKLETQGPGLIHLVAEAVRPDVPVKRSPLPVLALFLVAAASLGVAVPVLLDAADRRVRTPGDVEVCLRNVPLGWILERKEETESFVRDQIRRLALSLDRERKLYNRTQFSFMSLKSGGGTTRLLLDLGREFQTLGCRSVVVEANAFKPDPRISPGNGHPGLASVLTGSARVEAAILPSRNGLPDVLPVGNTGGNRFLPDCRNLRSVLDQLMGRYDVVLVDSPPLLVSSDAELLAGRTHGAVLVVEAEKTRSGELMRAIQILQQIGPPLIQVVLNRVQDYRGHGYYAQLVREHGAADRVESP